MVPMRILNVVYSGSVATIQMVRIIWGTASSIKTAVANIAAVCHTKESRQKRPFVQPSARGGKVGDSGTSAFNILRELPDVA